VAEDQPQISLAPGGPKASGAQVPPSSTSSLRLPRRSINWDHTPWQDDCFEDNEDMRALQTSIVTINHAACDVLSLLDYFAFEALLMTL
jgi:hypothetical protein